MTNMYPQLPGLNRSTWKLLETSVRGWAVQHNQSYTIYVGAVYNDQNKRIGKGVIVPHAFYKIVINNQTNEVAGWWFPHVEGLGTDLTKLRLPISQIEQQAGVKFAYPTNAKELQPGQEWIVNFGNLTKSKRAKCGSTASAD
jgi:endonuclease G